MALARLLGGAVILGNGSLSVVVPTKNSALTLARCLDSLNSQDIGVEVIVVDNYSSDSTLEIAKARADVVLEAGPERSAQRNIGAAAAAGDYLAFVDSDMVVGSSVMSEAVELLRLGASAVVIPEVSVGAGFWAAVRSFERGFYLGIDQVEAARVFRRDVFEGAGGFDVTMNAGEDWDLMLRVRKMGAIGRTIGQIQHLEGALTLRAAIIKKSGYAEGMAQFVRKNGLRTFFHALRRPYFMDPGRIVRHPILFTGVVTLKVLEAIAVAPRLASHLYRMRDADGA